MSAANSVKESISVTYRDFNVDGVPSSGPNEPEKARIRQTLFQIADLAGAAGTTKVVAKVADLAGLPSPKEGDRAEVRDDPAGDVEGGNGVYAYQSGAWVWISDLIPQLVDDRLEAVEVGLNYAITAVATVDDMVATPGDGRYIGRTFNVFADPDPSRNGLWEIVGPTIYDFDRPTLEKSVATSAAATAEVLRPSTFGGQGTVSYASPVDDTLAIAFLTASARLGQLTSLDKVHVVTAFSNPQNLKFSGPGRIMLQVAALNPALEGGMSLVNWNDDARLLNYGEEYLYPLRALLAKADPADRDIKVLVNGDSTFANPSGVLPGNSPNFPEKALPRIFNERLGLNAKVTVLNEAVGGTKFEDGWLGGAGTVSGTAIPTQLASGNFNVWIIKYGLNEGLDAAKAERPGSIQTAINAQRDIWRGRLSYVRNELGLTYDKLPIIVMGPNSAENVGYNDREWITAWNAMIGTVMREFQCVWFDCYSRWADAAKGATGPSGTKWLWTDGPYRNTGTAEEPNLVPVYGPLHPTDIGWDALWLGFEAFLRDALRTGPAVVDHTLNVSARIDAPAATRAPSLYPAGRSVHEVAAADGWPADGMVETVVSADRKYAAQTFWPAASNVTARRVRHQTNDAWLAW